MDNVRQSRKVPADITEPIRRAREEQQRSQRDVAKAAGVSRRAVSELENGAEVRVTTLTAIAGALGLAVRITSDLAA